MLSSSNSSKQLPSENDAGQHVANSPANRRYSLFDSSPSSSKGSSQPMSAVSLIKKKLTSGNTSTPSNKNSTYNNSTNNKEEGKFYNSMMNHKNKLAQNLIRRQATVSGGDCSPLPSGSTVCQRCQRFEVDLTNTSDDLSATDAELKASRQVISLLQRQLELFQVEKEGLEKLIVSQQANNCNPQQGQLNESHNDITELNPELISGSDNLTSSSGTTDGTNLLDGTVSDGLSADVIQKKLLTLIKTQLYAKDEEIVKLKSTLKETQNEKEQMGLQIHGLEDDVSKLKAENLLLRENLALRDQTIVSLSNEVFEQSSPTNMANKQRRQSSAETLLSPISNSSNRLHQKQILKLNDTLEAYKKTNELLNQNILKLTDRCATIERREMETKSQAQELEARCCQIQSKLLSLLKEIEQSSKHIANESDSTADGNSTSPSDEFIHSEPVKLLIKRLLEDKSLDIPLSWKEGNRTRAKVKSDELEDSSKQECDELGFYIGVSNDKSKKSTNSNYVASSPSDQHKVVGTDIRKGISETWGTYVSHLATVDEAYVADESIDDEYFRHKCIDSVKSNEAKWRQFWDDFIKDFDKMNLSKSKEFKSLLRSGVPQEYRCKIWKALIDLKIGNERKSYGSDYYQSLLEPNQSSIMNGSKQPGHMNPSSKQIELDLLRTLPNNKYFETIDSPGTIRLRRVLNAFAAHKPHIGYCQGMNRLAAVALLVLPEEEAFWCLVSIVDKIMPIGYYNDLWLAQVDSNVVMDFVAVMMPGLYEHFHAHSIELSLFAWFLTIFVDGTPPALFLRLWDCFLYEGDKIMFRVALALLKMHEDAILKLNSSVAINNYLRSSVSSLMDYDRLFHIAFELINPLPGKALRQKRESNFEAMRASIRPSAFSSSNKAHSPVSPDIIDGRYQKVSQQDDSPNEDSSIISV